MKFLKILGAVAGIVGGLAVIGLLIGLWMYRDIPRDELEARYANDASRFMNVAGARLHYRDEGPRDGPAVLLIHANFASLLGWEPWVDALKDKYRVVRFDMTSHGLTGPDPTGDYTLERTLELTEKFIDAVGLEKFSIGGTSLGGTMAVLYTAKYPERIDNLILLSPGSLEGKERKDSDRGEIPDAAYALKYIMPRALPEFMLTSGFSDDSKLSTELVDQWFELWRLEGQREAQLDRLKYYDSGDIESVFRSVSRPVLLLWGEDNQTAVFEQHEEVIELLSGAPSINFFSYPGVGHMAVQEAGDRIAIDVRRFLDGDRETGLIDHDSHSAEEHSDEEHTS
ncbi:MAG: alpha/beta hydrolase [Gammaproteobacteria bacterium]|nr:alpha/beta hydrolase [Gammaproteobacteria bacterium]